VTTLYRKWRPQTFAEVRGQERVVRTLQNALCAGRIGHAYLFCGPRGVGKTTTARLFAKAVNCLHEDDPAAAARQPGAPIPAEPDNSCSICRQITDGRSLDVIEIDAASNGRVDDARDLRDQINFAPNEARFKFYIIDEAHQITKDAFDALLKTFEEPPAHVIFVLATTDPNKVPPTILSRCQRFDFRRLSVVDIRASLIDICAAEGVEADPAALELLARAADGSSRDSQSLLDQAIAFSGQQISLAAVRSMLGLASAEMVEQLVDALLGGDARTGLELINQAADAGVDPRGLNRELVEHLRALLLLKVSSDTAATLDVAPESLPALRERAARLNTAALVRQIKIFSDADFGFRAALQAQLPLELAFLQATEIGASPPAAAGAAYQPPVIPAATTAAPSVPVPPQAPVPKRAAAAPAAAEAVRQPASEEGTAAAESKAEWQPSPAIAPADQAPADAEEQEPGSEQPAPAADSEDQALLQTILDRWPQVLDGVGAQSKTVQALLRSCAATSFEGATVSLLCDAEFHANTLQKPENKRMVEGALSRVLGRPCYVKCQVRQKKTDASGPRANEPDAVKPDENDPLVRAALRMLNARVLENN